MVSISIFFVPPQSLDIGKGKNEEGIIIITLFRFGLLCFAFRWLSGGSFTALEMSGSDCD